MTALNAITTAEQLLKAGDIGRCELVHGELIMMSPSGYPHGRVTYRLAQIVGDHVDSLRLGDVVGAETGFLIAHHPDTVRAPDLGFVRASRVERAKGGGFFPGAPDLAVEVLSPDDTASEVLAKTTEWLNGGAVAVWLVDPRKRTVAIHRREAPACVFAENDEVIAGEPVPALRFPVREIFE